MDTLLKNKDEFFSRFKELKALIENQTGRNMKTLKSNNGDEFKDFCAREGTGKSCQFHKTLNKMGSRAKEYDHYRSDQGYFT